MADSFKAKQITSLTENTSMADTDIVPVGNAGTSTLRRIKWANILAAIKSKITSWTYNFNTSSKTLEGAVNEMQGNISAINGSLENTSIVDATNGIGAVTYTRRGKLLELNAYWFGGSGVSPGRVLLCELPYQPVTWHHFASAYYNGVFTLEADGKLYFMNNTSNNITYACMHEIIFIK